MTEVASPRERAPELAQTGDLASLRLMLPPSVYAVATARRVAIELFRRLLGEDVVRVIGLLTSELVTNAVVHATTPFTLDITLRHGVVRVAVGDSGDGVFAPQDPVGNAEHGWGMHLLAELSTRWGTDALVAGKQVWFELDVAPSG